MRLATALLSLALISLSACRSGEGAPQERVIPAALGQEYVVGFGETIRVGALALEFTTLAEDSRCPLNATCVWEGNGRILVTATHGRDTSVLELNTASSRFPASGTFGGYRIELTHLAPYPPWSDQPVQTYEATLRVDRAGS